MDDEVLGAGATVARHIAAGDFVDVVICANRAYDHAYDAVAIEEEERCARAAQRVLGYRSLELLRLPDERLDAHVMDIVVTLEDLRRRLQPELVYICHRGDLNQDHRAVASASLIAFRALTNEAPARILSYEVPSATEQAPPFGELYFTPTVYVDASPYLDTKLAALRC